MTISVINWSEDTLSLTYCLARQYEEAFIETKKSLRLEPNSIIPLSIAYNQTGRENKARFEAKEVLRINPKFSFRELGKTMAIKA